MYEQLRVCDQQYPNHGYENELRDQKTPVATVLCRPAYDFRGPYLLSSIAMSDFGWI